MDDFVRGALRPLNACKNTKVLYDVSCNVPEFANLAALPTIISEKKLLELPLAARPGASLGQNDKLGLVIQNHHDGTMTILRVVFFEKMMTARQARAFAAGTPYVPLFREGPWAHKKAMQSLLERIPGFHVTWARLVQKESLQRKDSGRWEVTDEALDAGIAFINSFAPTDNDLNQQWLFIEKNIKPSSGSPIAGWPVGKVQLAVTTKTKANTASSVVERWFPLCIFDLHPVWPEMLLPMFFPLMTEFGLVFLGNPGVGKTPTFIILAMAMGRHLARTHGGSGRN